jgi:hypothetical protein
MEPKKKKKKLSKSCQVIKSFSKTVKKLSTFVNKKSKSCQKVVKKLSKKCKKVVKKVQKAQLAKLPHSIHHRARTE